MRGRAGFTLIEIMIVAGLAGVIASAALAPLVFTVGSLDEAQSRWGARRSPAAAVERIYSDARRVVANPSFPSFKVIHKSGLSRENDDRLVIWSGAPKFEGKGTGVVVYKIAGGGPFESEKRGLYRWTIVGEASHGAASGDSSSGGAKSPMDVDTDALDAKNAKLTLAGAEGVRFQIYGGEKWEDDYAGALPTALRTKIFTSRGTYSHTVRFPNAAKK